MSRGLGVMQRRILEALEPSQQICRRPGRPHQAGEPFCLEQRHDGPCLPEYCYGWLPPGVPWEQAQLPLDVYDLVDVRRYLHRQETPRWQAVEGALPEGKPFTLERVAWALWQYGKPNAHAFGADVARALRGLLNRGELVACHTIPLVRYRPRPTAVPQGYRPPQWRWIEAYNDEEAVLYYPPDRRVRFVTRGDGKR